MKVGLVSLGCSKNLVDSELMLGNLRSEGYEITNETDQADILVVNSCGFIESAKRSRLKQYCGWQSIRFRANARL